MNPRHLELSEEFCKLVSNAHLLEYLELPESVAAEQARSALRKRRKHMQGMQSNPKYKAEALYLIKNFAALDALLNAPAEYLTAVQRRQESKNLPTLEMTIRSVLKAGSLTQELETYLRGQAHSLGLSDETFEETITRLAAQSGLERPTQGSAQPEEALNEEEIELTDHYGLLGVSATAARDEVYDAYRARYRTVRTMADRERAERLYKRLDRAWQVLSDPSARTTYDLSLRNTGPPARNREDIDALFTETSAAATAPPVRRTSSPRTNPGAQQRSVVPGQRAGATSAVLEVVGPPVRQVRVGSEPTSISIAVRMLSDQVAGRVTTDEPWLLADPSRLEGGREHTITVHINPRDLPSRSATGVVTVQTEQGDRATIVLDVRRTKAVLPMVAGGAAAVGAVLGGVYLVLSTGLLEPKDTSVTFQIDPAAEEVLIDGVLLGSGATVVLPAPPKGEVTVTILQANFERYLQQMDLTLHAGTTLPIRLELSTPLTWEPGPDSEPVGLGRSAEDALGLRRRAVDDCIAPLGTPDAPATGTVRVHFGEKGLPIGVHVEGHAADDASVEQCVVRAVASARIAPLGAGQYGTVRYAYKVPEGAP